MKRFSYILFLILLTLGTKAIAAGGFSYIYIQGDKQLPFYVKLEDQMLPRYGKNYNLIPQLAPGIVNIQILFQQNVYPVQKFTIRVPENSYRGFLLIRKGADFTLYDIQQGRYIYAGNKAEDDLPPTNTSNTNYISLNKPKPVIKEVPVIEDDKLSTGQKFLNNVELSNDRGTIAKEIVLKDTFKQNTQNSETDESLKLISTKTIRNSDCTTSISSSDFDDLFRKAESKNIRVRLKYLLTQMDECYTTDQARILAKTLNNDPERYTFLKRVYPRITNQGAFPALESLLSTQEWKSYFKLILP